MINEITTRLGLFLVAFCLIASWEILAPRRHLNFSRSIRWLSNIGMGLLNQLVLRLCFPVLAVALAVVAQQRGWGLINIVRMPEAFAIVACFLLLDLAIYLQHIAFHHLPWLWRLHRVHHSDLDFDVTTALRFHPLEIILSMLIKMVVVLLLGAPPLVVLTFEVALNLTSMFNHGNTFIPLNLDRVLRLFVVTPDMHRVHHSIEDNETNSNFGFNLSLWDRLFGTYIDQPRAGHLGMTIGIHQYREPREVSSLVSMLALPFVGEVKGYAINRREWSDPHD